MATHYLKGHGKKYGRLMWAFNSLCKNGEFQMCKDLYFLYHCISIDGEKKIILRREREEGLLDKKKKRREKKLIFHGVEFASLTIFNAWSLSIFLFYVRGQ